MTQRDLTTDDSRARTSGEHLRLLEAGERVARIGSWEWLPQAGIRLWSDNLYRLVGCEPGAVPPTRQLIHGLTHPDDLERVTRYADAARRTTKPPPMEFRIRHPTDGVRHLRSTITTVERDARGSTRIVGVIEDVTDEHLTAREIAAHLAVARTLAEWDTLQDGVTMLLAELSRALEFVLGKLWLPRTNTLAPIAVWSEPSLGLSEIETTAPTPVNSFGADLAGRAWRSKQPETLLAVDEDKLLTGWLAEQRAGLRGAVAFPAMHAGEAIAVLEFYHREDVGPIDRLRRTLVALGRELGEFFSRHGGQLQAQRLTPRQLRVLELAAAGNTTPQIAAELGVSRSTVRTHFDHLYEKLGVGDRAAAVAQALRLGLIK